MKSSNYSVFAFFANCLFTLFDIACAQNYYPFRFGFGIGNTSTATAPIFSIHPSVRIVDDWLVGTKIEAFFQAGGVVTQLPIMDCSILLMDHTSCRT